MFATGGAGGGDGVGEATGLGLGDGFGDGLGLGVGDGTWLAAGDGVGVGLFSVESAVVGLLVVVSWATCWLPALGVVGCIAVNATRINTTSPAHPIPANHLVDERNSGMRPRNPHPLLAKTTMVKAPMPRASQPRDSGTSPIAMNSAMSR